MKLASKILHQIVERIEPSIHQRALEVGPYAFVRVDLGGVGRKRFELQTRKASAKIRQRLAPVNGLVVEQYNHVTAQMVQQMTRELILHSSTSCSFAWVAS